MKRAIAFGVLLLALLPGCLTTAPTAPPTPTFQVELEIDGQKKAVAPTVMAKGRYFWELRPASGPMRGISEARQAGLPADTYAINLSFSPPKPDAGFPVGDGLPSEGNFHQLDDAGLVITGPDPDTFFFEKTYDGNASYTQKDSEGKSYTPLFFYQSSQTYIIGKYQDTLQRAAGQPAVKVVISFEGPFPTYTVH